MESNTAKEMMKKTFLLMFSDWIFDFLHFFAVKFCDRFKKNGMSVCIFRCSCDSLLQLWSIRSEEGTTLAYVR